MSEHDAFGALRSILQRPLCADVLTDLFAWAEETPGEVFWSDPVSSYLEDHLLRWPLRLRIASPDLRERILEAEPETKRRLLHVAPVTNSTCVPDIDPLILSGQDHTHWLWSKVFGPLESLEDARQHLDAFGWPIHLTIEDLDCYGLYYGMEQTVREHLELAFDPNASCSPRSLYLTQDADRCPSPWTLLSRFQDLLRPAHVIVSTPLSKGEQETHRIEEMLSEIEPGHPLETIAAPDGTLTDEDVSALAAGGHLFSRLRALCVHIPERSNVSQFLGSALVAQLDTLILGLDWDPLRWGSIQEDPPSTLPGKKSKLDEVLIQWARGASPGLKRLALRTDTMTGYAMEALADSAMAESLEDVRLFGEDVDEAALRERFASRCPNLREFRINRTIRPGELFVPWGFIPHNLHSTIRLSNEDLGCSIWGPRF